jgi:hypothetical protein
MPAMLARTYSISGGIPKTDWFDASTNVNINAVNAAPMLSVKKSFFADNFMLVYLRVNYRELSIS